MQRPLLAILVTAWMVAGSFPVVLPSGSDGATAAPPRYGDESFGRFEWIHPFPTGNNLNAVAWSPDGKQALITGATGTLLGYDGMTFTTVYSGTDAGFTGVAWYPSGDYALISGTGGRLLRYENGALSELPTGTTVDLAAVSINPNTGLGLAVGAERTVLLIDDGEVTTVSSGGNIALATVAWEPGGSYALVSGAQSTGGPQRPGVILRYWPENNTLRGVFSQPNYIFTGSAFSPNSETAVLVARYMDSVNGQFEGRAFLWNDTGLYLVATALPVNVNGACWSPDGTTAYIVSQTALYAFDTEGAPSGLPLPVQNARAMAWRPDGSAALLVGTAGTVYSFDGLTVNNLSSARSQNTLNAAAWSPDGTMCLAVGAGGEVMAYDGTRLTAINIRVKGLLRTFNGVAWHPDGTFALLVGDAGTMVQYNRDGTYDSNIQSGTVQNLRACAWAPNGSYAVVVGDSGTVRKYTDLVSSPVPSVTEYTLRGVAFRPNDSIAMIIGGDVRSVQGPTGRISTSWQVVLEYNGRIISPGRMIQQGPVFNSISFRPAVIAADGGNLVVMEEHGPYKHYNTTSAANLLAADWMQDGRDALALGEGGAAMLFNYSRSEVRSLVAGTIQPFTAVAVRPQGDYAVGVGWNGMIMKYVPNAPPVPVKLNPPSSVTDSSMELGWSASKDRDFNRLELFQSLQGNFNAQKTILNTTDRSKTSLTVSGLTRLTTYHFKARVWDNAGLFSDSNAVSATTLLGNIAPAASVLSAPSSVTDSSMKLDWTRNKDADFARYELHKGGSKNFVISANTLQVSITDQERTSETVMNLSPSTNYYFKLRTVDTGGLTNDSNEVNASTVAVNVPPSAVKLDPPSEVGDTALKLSWSQNGDSDFDRYEIYMGNRTGFGLANSTLLRTIAAQATVNYTVEGLTNNTTYFFRMRVVDTGGLRNDSNEVNTTTTPPNAPPEPVTLYPPTNIGETSLTLSWSANNDRDFKQYEVAGSTAPGFTITQNTILKTLVDKAQTSTDIAGLLPDTAHYFKVRVVDKTNLFSDSNEESVVTLPNTSPAAVSLYGPDNVTADSMDIEWSESAAGDFSRYEVYRSEIGNFSPTSVLLAAQVTDRLSVVYRAIGLKPSTTYHFKVRVVDTGDLTNDSNEVSDTTKGPDLPPVAVVLADPPSEVTETTVLLEWTRNNDADFARYGVHRSTVRGFVPGPATEARNLTDQSAVVHNVTGLKPDTTYYFKVVVEDLTGHSNSSNEVRARTVAVNVPPVADAGQDRTFTAGRLEMLSGAGYDTDGQVVLYEWDFDGDGTYDSSLSNGNQTHIFPDPGVFTAVLRVTDDRGGTGTDSARITVEPPVPPNILPVILDAGEDVLAYIGEDVGFSGNATDPDGHITMYQWDFHGDGLYAFSSPDGANTTYYYTAAGVYRAVLKVTDDRGGTATAIRNVEIKRFNNPPVARIDSPPDRKKYYTDEVVTLSAVTSYDPDGDRLTYLWDNAKDGKKLGSSVTARVTLEKGDYQVRLTVSDGELSGSASVNITVQERPNVRPTVRIEAPANNSIVKGSVTISGSAKDDNKVSYVEIRIDPSGRWQKAAGARYWSFELDTRPMELGKHTIYVRAYDGTDYSDEASIALTVNNPTPKRSETGAFIPGFESLLLGLAAAATVLVAMRRRR